MNDLLSRKIPFILTLFMLAFLASPGISIGSKSTTSIVEAAAIQYKTTSNLNVRTGPSTKHKVITTIPKGKTVSYISKSGSWYKVKYKTKNGYVSSKYLTKINPKKTQPTISKGYNVPILMYHAIDEFKGSGLKELYVTPKNFEAQMKYLKSAGFTPIMFDDLTNIKKIKKPILITLDDGYKNNINAYTILKKINSKTFKSKATIFMIGNKIDTKNGLSTSKLKEMSNSGIMSIQSHTMTHPSLKNTKDYKKELKDIKTKIEKITKKPVTAIAYPSGQYNSAVIAQTKKYYKYAVTTKSGIANTSASHYEMKRVRINYSTSLSAFKKMVNP